MSLKWSIGLMTGTVNDGFIDIAALRTDGTDAVSYTHLTLPTILRV